VILKVNASGNVSAFAGSYGSVEVLDGVGSQACFKYPTSIVINRAEIFLYVCDNFCIRRVDISNQRVSTFCGNAEIRGHKDGHRVASLFIGPSDLCIDRLDNLYVADHHVIRKVSAEGAFTSTVAGSSCFESHKDGIGSEAHFTLISDLTIDFFERILYVVDNGKIRSVELATRLVSTIKTNFGGDQDILNEMHSITVDARGTLVVSCTAAHCLLTVNPETGFTQRLAGRYFEAGVRNGDRSESTFCYPTAMCVHPVTGEIFLSDSVGAVVRRISSTSLVGKLRDRALVSMNIIRLARLLHPRFEHLNSVSNSIGPRKFASLKCILESLSGSPEIMTFQQLHGFIEFGTDKRTLGEKELFYQILIDKPTDTNAFPWGQTPTNMLVANNTNENICRTTGTTTTNTTTTTTTNTSNIYLQNPHSSKKMRSSLDSSQ
jgi:hypothetical protein